MLSADQEIEATVLVADRDKRRLSLTLDTAKQTEAALEAKANAEFGKPKTGLGTLSDLLRESLNRSSPQTFSRAAQGLIQRRPANVFLSLRCIRQIDPARWTSASLRGLLGYENPCAILLAIEQRNSHGAPDETRVPLRRLPRH